MKYCCVCGKEINVKGKTKYCPECKKEHRRKYIADYCRINKENISIDAGDYALLARYAKENKLTLNKAFHKIVVDSLEKA
jgi:hypothetical protein